MTEMTQRTSRHGLGAGAALAAATMLVALACSSSTHRGLAAGRGPSTTAVAVRSTTTSAPTTTLAPLPPATVAARRAFFGSDNVDTGGHVRADRVIVSWFGIASLAVSIEGRVVLLDTYINNPGPCGSSDSAGTVGSKPYVPTDYAQLAALKPEAIFVGHGHSDHACELGQLVRQTGATVVGLPQHCALAEREAGTSVSCLDVLPADSKFGATAEVHPLGDQIQVTAVRNLHSGPDTEPPCNTGGCEAVLYRFSVDGLSFVWNDTNGPIATEAPDLVKALQALPASDVEFGSILGLGLAVQGMRDPVDYAQALRVGVLYPLHHDTGRGGGSAGFRAPLDKALAARPGLMTTLHWLQDPADYLRPIVLTPRPHPPA